MKTVLQIKSLQEDVRQEMQDVKARKDLSKKVKDRRIKALSDKISWYQKGINYLEFEPSDAFITLTISRLKEEIQTLSSRVVESMKVDGLNPQYNTTELKKRTDSLGIDRKKKQLKFLSFIYTDN